MMNSYGLGTCYMKFTWFTDTVSKQRAPNSIQKVYNVSSTVVLVF